MIGTALETFITGLNGGATIDATLLNILVDNAKTIIEGERPWMVLRKTDKSLSLTTSNTWETAKDMSGITDFSELYGEYSIKLFDGDNRVEYYRKAPFDRRLEFKDISDSFILDDNGKIFYFNGVVAFNGTLWINYIATTPQIDLESDTAVWSPFPSRFVPLLGYYAIGIHKGAIDYDSVNRAMLPENRVILETLKSTMEDWDNTKQLSDIDHNDPTDNYANYPSRSSVDRSQYQ